MANATGKALQTFQGILTQLEKQPSDPNAKPFEIKDYAATAVEINRMSLRLTELLKSLHVTLDPANMAKLSAEADNLTLKTQQRSQAVVDYAFQKGLLLVAFDGFDGVGERAVVSMAERQNENRTLVKLIGAAMPMVFPLVQPRTGALPGCLETIRARNHFFFPSHPAKPPHPLEIFMQQKTLSLTLLSLAIAAILATESPFTETDG